MMEQTDAMVNNPTIQMKTDYKIHDPIEIFNAITASNDSGRLALGVYLIHGYPSLEISKQAFDLLQTYETTIFECGLPVALLHGSNISDIIKEAHNVASKAGVSDEELISFYASYRPNLLIHLKDEQRQNVEILRDRIQGSIDAVMTDNVEFLSMLERPLQDQKLPLLIQFVSTLSQFPEQNLSVKTMLVYLGVASRTGGELLPSPQIQSAVDTVVKAAPNAKIICGFGIRTVSDVKRLSHIRGIHGLAIGTEALRVLKEGITDFKDWLSEIDCALFWET